MVSGFISRIVILVFGTLYPAYASYKAVRTKNVKEYVKWMMYWIVFALFTCAETFTDLFLSFWFPFYYEIKIITVIYLLSPATKGSSILYRKFVHPVLAKREQEIDEYIAKAKEQGYHTMLNLGSKGVNYATSLIMQTAIKSGGGLVSQLKKSYSLNDLSGDQSSGKTSGSTADVADSPYRENPRLTRRSVMQGPHSTASSPGQTALFFPDPDMGQRPDDEGFRQIPSVEEVNSGNSSWEPYNTMQESKGCNLVRTASLGPSSRTRTRVLASKQGLPKRSQLTEGGSAWSAMEPHESQNEADSNFNFSFGRSETFPFLFPSFQNFSSPEYQHFFGNLTQNQIFAFVNRSLYSQFLGGNASVNFENSTKEVFENLNRGNWDNLAVIVTEENSDGQKNETMEEETEILEVAAPTTNSDISKEAENDEKKENNRVDQREKKKEEIETVWIVKEEDKVGKAQNQNSEKEEGTLTNESLDAKEKTFYERSGKYNKKPAPTPPIEEYNSKVASLSAEEEETAFFTPNASPKPGRKNTLSGVKSSTDHENEEKPHDNNLLEVPKKFKSKAKKTDFNIQKKLHIPKMSFTFWHQKGGKQSSVSETSSIASVDIPSTNFISKNDAEYYIPLRDGDNTSDKNGTDFCIRNSPQTQEKRKEEIDD